MHLAILGTGSVGRALAAGFTDAGHDVTIGTRDPEATLARGADGPDETSFAEWHRGQPAVQLATFADAAAGGDVVINATAGGVSVQALEAAGTDSLAGKVLWDVANPLDFSQGMPPAMEPGDTDSLAETIQRAHPDARVVKALNTVNAGVMIAPGQLPERHQVFLSGDHGDAKATVADLLADLGWPEDDVIDLGGIETARATEGYLPLWLTLAGRLGTVAFNVRIVSAR